MSYLGDKLAGDTIYFKFTSVNTSGVPTAVTTPVLAVYKNNSTSESQAGLTLTAGFDGFAGLHQVTIDTSQDGTFYANGGDFQVVMVTGSVSSNSIVGYVVGEFSLANRSALRPTTANRTLDVSAGGEAGLDWANIGSPTTAQNLSATNIDVDQVVASVSGAVGSVTSRVTANVDQLNGGAQSLLDLKDFADDGYDPSTNKVQGVVLTDTVTTYTGNTPQTGDSFARLGLPAGASVSADILVIDNLVDDLESRLGTPSNFGSGATIAANLVDIEAQTDDIGVAGAGLTAIPWNAAWDAEVQSEVTDALNAYDPPTHAELVSEINSVQTDIAVLNDLSATEVADAVWDAVLADHLDAGSTGAGLNAAGSAGDPWGTALPGAYGAGTAGKIVGDNLNATVSSRASQTSLDTLEDFVDTEVGDIKAKTDQLTFTTSNRVDSTVVDKTGFSLSAAGVQAIWDALTSALTTGGSIGKLLVDNVNATISSRSSHSAADVWAVATRILTAGTNIVLAKGTGVTGFNDLSAAQVNAEADTALADYDPPTHADLVSEVNSVQSDIASLNNLSAAQVNAEVDTALADVNLDHLVGTATGIPAIPAGTYLDQIMDDGTAVYDRATDSLQAIRDRGDAAWDTADVSALALQSSVDDLEGRLTAARAGYLENLNVGGNVASAASISALNNLSAAQVNAEVVDALAVDTYTEPGQEVPPATTTLAVRLRYLYKILRNKKTQTATTLSLYDDAGTTVDQKATISDDGTTYTHGEIGTGP
jgi:hypothetical protein